MKITPRAQRRFIQEVLKEPRTTSKELQAQGWIGNRAYRAFSQWADSFKGPTECFNFFCQGPSRRDNEQPVAHWFVSCIDSVNHPITMRYRQSDEVFCSAYKDRLTSTSSSSSCPMLSQQLYQEQACSAVSDAGQIARQEEKRKADELVKCLIGTRNGDFSQPGRFFCPSSALCRTHLPQLRSVFKIQQ